MRRRLSRGFVLRVGSALTAAMVTASVSVVVTPEALAAPVVGNAWVPSMEVNREAVGGPPPATPAVESAGASAQSITCATYDLGVLPDYPVERFRVSDRFEFFVNLANGNLALRHRALSVRGTGLDLDLGYAYSSDEGYGGRWRFNAGDDMGLDFRTGLVLMPVDSGACVEFRENADGTYEPATHGLRARLTKNPGGSYTARFIDSGETWAFNASGWPLHRADRNGNAVTYHYNTDGSLASLTDTQGRVTTFASDTNEKVTKVIDPTGTVAAEYRFGESPSITDRDGETIGLGLDPDNELPSSLTDPLGRVWSFAYDEYGRVTKVGTPRQMGAVETLFAYDSDTQTTVTDPNANKTVHTLDNLNRQTKAVNALGHTRSRTWTASSSVQSVMDGLNNSTTATYDSLDNLTSVKLPTGASNAVGYTNTALPNVPTSVKDPAGNELTREYDDAGNLTKIRSTQLAADLEVRTYSGPKRVLSARKDANGNTTRFAHDPAGNLITMTPPAPMGPTRYTYDALSRITSITDGAGKRIDYGYDRLDRVVSISHNGTPLQTMTYDALGNLLTRAAGSVTTRFAYDTYPTGSQPIYAERTQIHPAESVSYTYDKAGNLTSLTDPAGKATYSYDAANRLTSLADPFGQTTTFGYDNADRRTSTTWPGAGAQTNGYDKAGRLTSLVVKNTGDSELFKATYAYTASGADRDQLQSKTIAGTTTAYTYDSLRHLTKAGTTTYTVDKADNITNFGGAAHTVNAANQLTGTGATTLGYDAAGNLTSATNPSTNYTYSPTNQLTRATNGGAQTFSAAYDTTDHTQVRSITETVGATTTNHVFTHTALGISSAVVNGTRTSVTRDPDGTLLTQRAGTARRNLITDHQGSVLAMLDTTGALVATYTYSPYGTATTSGAAAATNPFRYIGGYTLNNGHILFGHRYYNPTWGRFTQPDPSGQERNAYAYSACDPINNSDPSGLDYLTCVGQWAVGNAIVGGGIGGVFGSFAGGVGAVPGAIMGAGAGGLFGAIGGLVVCGW